MIGLTEWQTVGAGPSYSLNIDILPIDVFGMRREEAAFAQLFGLWSGSTVYLDAYPEARSAGRLFNSLQSLWRPQFVVYALPSRLSVDNTALRRLLDYPASGDAVLP